MPETSIIIAGIGGQGVQLLSKTLARAALAEGRCVMLSSEYGGEMRGGRSFASVVIGDGPLRALPVLETADVALVLHDKYWEESDPLLCAGGLLFADSAFVDPIARKTVITDPPRRIVAANGFGCAKEVGSALGGGLALLASFCAHTGFASTDQLVAVMAQLTPPYRQQHVPANERAIRAGAALALSNETVPA